MIAASPQTETKTGTDPETPDLPIGDMNMAKRPVPRHQIPEPRTLGVPTGPWATSPGAYISGSSAIDGMDVVAREMEQRWGVDRLRLVVTNDLREKFDRQRYLVNQAIWHGQLHEVVEQAERMGKAYKALDRAATASGAQPLSPVVWEVPLKGGRVLAIVQTGPEAHAVAKQAAGRDMVVWTLEEVAAMVSAQSEVNMIKATFPGAAVTATRRTISDPLNGLLDSRGKLDDDLPF